MSDQKITITYPPSWIVFDQNFQIINIGDFTNETLGGEPDINFWDLIPAELTQIIQKLIENVFVNQKTQVSSYHKVLLNNEICYTRVKIHLYKQSADNQEFILIFESLSAQEAQDLWGDGKPDVTKVEISAEQWNNIIFDKANLGVCIIDEEGFFVKINRAYCSLVGYQETELLKNNIQLIFPSNFLTIIKNHFQNFLLPQQESETEWKIRRKDKTFLDVLVTIKIYTHSSGKRFIINYLQDITYNKQVESILKHTQKVAKIGNWELDVLKGFLSWTDEIYQIYEIPTDVDITLETSLQYYLPASKVILEKAIDAAIVQGLSFDLDLAFISANHTSKTIRITCEPIKDNRQTVKLLGTFQDISNRKDYQEQLENLWLVVNQITSGVLVTNEDGQIEWANEGFERLWGYSLVDVKGKKTSDFLFGQDTNRHIGKKIRQQALQRKPVNQEILYYHKDGNASWTSVQITPILNEQGELSKFLEIQTNIHAQKTAELAIYENEDHFISLLDNIPILIWEADTLKNRTYFNKFWLDFTGTELQDQVGYGWTKNVHPDDLPKYLSTYDKAFTEQKKFKLEYRLRRKDGEYRWVLADGTPWFHKDGSFAGFMGVCMDITDKNIVQSQIAFQADILKSVKESIIVTDLEGKIIYYNRESEEIFGYTAQEMLGQSPQILYPTYNMSAFEHESMDGLENYNYNDIWKGKHKKGYEVWVDITTNFVKDAQGNIAGVLVIAKDITERQVMEYLLEETGRMANIGGWELNLETNQLTWTPQTYRIHEVPVGKKISVEKAINFYHPDYRHLIRQAVNDLIERKKEYDIELIMITTSGKHLWVRTKGSCEEINGKVFKIKGTFQNIHSQKIMQLAHEEYIRLVGLSSELFSIATFEGYFIQLNPAWERALGYSLDELMTKPFIDFIHPEDKEITHQEAKRLATEFVYGKNETINFINRYVTKQGESRWLSWNSTSIASQGRYYSVARDITQEVIRQQQNQESEAHLKAVFESSEEGYFLINTRFELLKFNKAATNIFANLYQHTLQTNEDFRFLLTQDILTDFISNFTQALKGTPNTIEIKLKNFWYKLNFQPAFDINNQLFGVALFALDITAKKIAEINFVKNFASLQNFQRALNASALTSVTDLDGNITRANRAFCKATGYLPRELIGQNHRMLNSKYHPTSFFQEMWDTISQGDYWRGEIRNIDKFGKYFWMDVLICPIKDEYGVVYEYLSINYLITHKKTSDEMRDLLIKQLRDFAFMTSHNLRRPLANILGLISIFDYTNTNQEFNKDVLKKMHQSASELDEVIHKMNNILEKEINRDEDAPQISD